MLVFFFVFFFGEGGLSLASVGPTRAVACIIDMHQLSTPHSFLVYFTNFSCNLGVKIIKFHFNLKISGNNAEM